VIFKMSGFSVNTVHTLTIDVALATDQRCFTPG